MKRLMDIVFSIVGLLAFSPLLIPCLIATWLQDFHSPFYIAPRVGKNMKLFDMIKVRSMVVNADKTGVASTSSNDNRITAVGRFIRKYKIDEISQLINVLKGDMSLVGPRPNVKPEVDLYTNEERHLLDVKPGITDFASIVFSDENDILKDSKDPDLDYNQLIRPWKSRLGLVYIKERSIMLDFRLIFLTAYAILNKPKSLSVVSKMLKKYNLDSILLEVCKREKELFPFPPPGADKIVSVR